MLAVLLGVLDVLVAFFLELLSPLLLSPFPFLSLLLSCADTVVAVKGAAVVVELVRAASASALMGCWGTAVSVVAGGGEGKATSVLTGDEEGTAAEGCDDAVTPLVLFALFASELTLLGKGGDEDATGGAGAVAGADDVAVAGADAVAGEAEAAATEVEGTALVADVAVVVVGVVLLLGVKVGTLVLPVFEVSTLLSFAPPATFSTTVSLIE